MFIAGGVHAGPSSDEVRRMPLQNYIDNQAPLAGTTWIGTHNAYAASSDGYNPANQTAPMRVQLAAGYRVLALDLSGANGTIRLCHKVCIPGQQRPFENGLMEINDWLRQNPDEVIMLVIEDDMDHDWQREYAGDVLKSGPLAGKIYSPELHSGSSTGTCKSLPMNSITKDDMLSQGKQVIVTSYQGCSANGTEWRRQAWNIPSNSNLTSTYDFTNYTNLRFSDKLSIIAEDGSFWGKNTELLSGEEKDLNHYAIADALYRGVGMIGLDFAVVNARHSASIWSWAPNFPVNGLDCAVSDFRRSHYSRGDMWVSANCNNNIRPIACVGAGNVGRQTDWVIANAGKFADGHSICASMGKIFRAPVNANENSALTTVKYNTGTQEVTLNYKKHNNSDSSWAPSLQASDVSNNPAADSNHDSNNAKIDPAAQQVTNAVNTASKQIAKLFGNFF